VTFSAGTCGEDLSKRGNSRFQLLHWQINRNSATQADLGFVKIYRSPSNIWWTIVEPFGYGCYCGAGVEMDIIVERFMDGCSCEDVERWRIVEQGMECYYVIKARANSMSSGKLRVDLINQPSRVPWVKEGSLTQGTFLDSRFASY